jgi:rubrerythrin
MGEPQPQDEPELDDGGGVAAARFDGGASEAEDEGGVAGAPVYGAASEPEDESGASPAPVYGVASEPEDESPAAGASDGLVVVSPPAQGGVAADVEALAAIDSRLAEVDLALQRLDEGTYWTCEVCGATIPEPLLSETPLRRCCASCVPVGAAERVPLDGRLFPVNPW